MAPQGGLEPNTLRLTAECSAIELLRNVRALARRVVNYKQIVTSHEPERQTPARGKLWNSGCLRSGLQVQCRLVAISLPDTLRRGLARWVRASELTGGSGVEYPSQGAVAGCDEL